VYFTSYHDVLCCLYEQVEQSKPDGKLEDMVAQTNKEKAVLENHLACCLEENESLRRQIMEVKAAHQVS
jgi:hypothetical protein